MVRNPYARRLESRRKRRIPGEDDANRAHPLAAQLRAMPDEVKAIELWPCGTTHDARRKLPAKATTIARSVDTGEWPLGQHELSAIRAGQIAERERGRGPEIVTRGAGL